MYLTFDHFYYNIKFLLLGNVVWDDENTTKRAYNAKSQEFPPKALLNMQDNHDVDASDGNC